jgi:hypothetical protein
VLKKNASNIRSLELNSNCRAADLATSMGVGLIATPMAEEAIVHGDISGFVAISF